MHLIKFYTRILFFFNLSILSGIGFSACTTDLSNVTDNRSDMNLPAVEYIEPDPETGFSLATVVKDVPLAFTNQLFPFDENGNIMGSSSLTEQLDQVIRNAEIALKAAGTDLGSLVRIHLYLKNDTMADEALKRLKEALPEGTAPAITFISGGTARPGVLVSMDIVAVAPEEVVKERVSLYQTEGISGQPNRSDVAVLAPGRKVFISGQAVMGDDLSDATHQTMRNLFATLAYIGAKAEDVVQVKAFMNPINDASSIEGDIASFFRGRKAPPIISVEWITDPNRVEIELIASAPADNAINDEVVSYYAPPWMIQATTYSRVVDIQKGGLFFTSGLYGEGQDGQAQAYQIFEKLNKVLDKSGSDYDHLVKGTYYPSTDDGRQGFVSTRPEFYNPEKPPAASLIRVQGTGRTNKSINVDFIGAIPE
jgi:enamine deaminase RidA (YjgF/YER057c/UK114 family)